MKTLIARYGIEWMMARAERVFFVYGMRRAGNHACVGWLINALEGDAVTLIESPLIKNFNYSSSGKTFFINDVSTLDNRSYLKHLYRDLKPVRQARFIIISAEDMDASYGGSWRIPGRSEAILVRRSTLNLVASRFQNLNRRAREGLGARMQSMGPRFFATLRANLASPRGSIWYFERWHDDVPWRRRFLANLGLEHDILPPMVGLGSSFSESRALPGADLLSQRFTMVEPRDAWKSFIGKAACEFPDIFSAEELAAIQAMADG